MSEENVCHLGHLTTQLASSFWNKCYQCNKNFRKITEYICPKCNSSQGSSILQLNLNKDNRTTLAKLKFLS